MRSKRHSVFLYVLLHVFDGEAGDVGHVIVLHLRLILILFLRCRWWRDRSSCKWGFWKQFVSEKKKKTSKKAWTRLWPLRSANWPVPEGGAISCFEGLMMPVEMSLVSRSVTSTWRKWFSGAMTCGSGETEQTESEMIHLHIKRALSIWEELTLMCKRHCVLRQERLVEVPHDLKQPETKQ